MSDNQSDSGKSNAGIGKKPKLQIKHRLWNSEHASLALSEDPVSLDKYVVSRINKAVLPVQQQAEVSERIKAIGQREFPGVLKVLHVAASTNEIVILSSGVTSAYSELISDKKQPPLRCVSLLLPLAKQLDALHEKRIVHGDLRPETLFITKTGELAAASFAPHHTLHQWTMHEHKVSSEISGFFAPKTYYAPEIQAGQEASPKSDQFSLALIALETVLQKRIDIQNSRNDLLKQLLKSSQGLVKSAIQKALDPTPENRFATCEEFIETLTNALREVQPKKGGQSFRNIAVCLLLAPLLLAPGTKWLMARNQQIHLNQQAESEKQEELDRVHASFVSQLTAPAPQPRSTALASNMAERSHYQKWFELSAKKEIDAGKQNMTSAFTRWKNELPNGLSRKLTQVPPRVDQRKAFFFNSFGNILCEGAEDAAVTLTISGFRPPQAPLSSGKIRFSVHPESGSPLTQELTLTSGSNSQSLEFILSPPKKTWTTSQKFTFQFSYYDDAQETWKLISTTSPSLGEIYVGNVLWKKYPTVSVTPGNASTLQCNVPTKVNVKYGDKVRVSVTGSVQLFSKDKHNDFETSGAQQNKTDFPSIGPSGVYAKKTQFQQREYFVVHNHQSDWGAMLLKFGGGGGWLIPSRISQPMTSSGTGEIYLGINSLSHHVTNGKRVSLFDDDTYWHNEGQFNVTIEHQELEVPSSISSSIRASFSDHFK